MRISEPKPHQINELLVCLDSGLGKTEMPRDRASFGIGTLSRRKMATFRGNRRTDLGDDYP
jgi:hypothetical protein